MSRTSQSATGLGGTAGVSSAPSRSDASLIEAQGVTAEAAAVLAAAEQSFASVESLDEAGAAAVASAAAANWSPSGGPSHYHNESGYFPVRALVFPETPTEEKAPREKAKQGVQGSAVDGSEACCGEGDVGVIPSGKYDSTVTTVEDSERDESSVPGAKAVSATRPMTVDVLSSMGGNEDPSFPAAPSPTGSDVGDGEGGDGLVEKDKGIVVAWKGMLSVSLGEVSVSLGEVLLQWTCVLVAHLHFCLVPVPKDMALII